MTVLYIYPHPDDESFGPAEAMARDSRLGRNVQLLTLTRGGATRQRHAFGYSVREMGDVRYREMQDVARVLGLTGMHVLDLPDSGLAGIDPRDIERAVSDELEHVRPDVTVTYPVHGISGFHDHLVAHATVKRAWVEARERVPVLKRLAFATITEEDAAAMSGPFTLSGTPATDIDCIVRAEEEDVAKARDALDCYVTFRETIEKTAIREFKRSECFFEFYRESFDPPLCDLFEGLGAD